MKTLTPPALCEHLALIRDSLEGRIEDRRVIDQAIGEIRLKYALAREPAPCPHREALESALGYIAADVEPTAPMHASTASVLSQIGIALSQPCAAPGEPSQEDFDGMQRWLDDALRSCRDDDHKRLKYLHADVRILAAARRWVARAAPGEAGVWQEVARGTPRYDCVPPVEIENAMKAGVEHVVYRRRATEREGGAR